MPEKFENSFKRKEGKSRAKTGAELGFGSREVSPEKHQEAIEYAQEKQLNLEIVSLATTQAL